MKNLQELLNIIESNDISIDEYTENEKLCGYELNAYTDGSVNEILFLDFRNKKYAPKNPADFIAEFQSYVNDYSIDDKIDMYRNDKFYKQNFTIQESLEDFQKFKQKLSEILNEMKS